MPKFANVTSIAAVCAALTLVVSASVWFNGLSRETLASRSICFGPDGTFYAGAPGYAECTKLTAQLFITHDYGEMKDLSKAFLTLLTAVFVASVTFSERIVNFHAAPRGPKYAMAACWALLLVAIAAVGTALALMTYALGVAVYSPAYDFLSLEMRAVTLFMVSGLSFGAALTSMLVAATLTLMRHGAQEPGISAPTPLTLDRGSETTPPVGQQPLGGS